MDTVVLSENYEWKDRQKATGKKPLSTTRTSAKTDGAFGKEQIDQVTVEAERNLDNAVSKRKAKRNL